MKKILCVILSMIMILPVLTLCASAVSLSEGTTKLNARFTDGELSGKLDYVSFSPVNGTGDTTKYPLLVWLHGMKSGLYKRAQLNSYEFSNWASDEYQSRFTAGGCFLLAVRASNSDDNSWSEEMCSDLYDTIKYYISLNSANIDTSRIYIAGYSTGATMVWDMAAAYPDFFAAALPLAAIFQPSQSELNKLAGVSVWMFSSDIDYYQLSETEDVEPNYNYLRELKTDLSTLRFTHFSEAVYADGTKKMNGVNVADEAEHYIWECFTYDMHMADGVTPYKYGTTVDGYGNTISFSDGTGIITWLNSQSKQTASTETGKVSFATRFKMWLQSIIAFFRKLFKY